MRCPKCQFDPGPDGVVACPRCGIVIAKYLRAHAGVALHATVPPAAVATATPETDTSAPGQHASGQALRDELTARAIAIPAALITAWMAVSAAPSFVRLFAMWIHESGHTVAAWLCGHAAMPGPWFTPVGSDRSLALTGLFVALLGYGAYRAWQAGRWFWVASAVGGTVVLLGFSLLLRPGQAQQFIVFGGDAGCFVLGSVLMLTVYARYGSPIRENHLRWGLVVFGALAFMDAAAVWSGSVDRIPFGENDNGLSDPSVLTEEYGWSVVLLQSRYQRLATACLVVVGCAYVGGLLGPWMSARESDSRDLD